MHTILESKKNATMDLPNYQILDVIGEGGSSKIYKALQINTGQNVAIKLFHDQLFTQDSIGKHRIARYEREVQICAEINHPYIVKVLDKGYVNKTPYVVFEYIIGVSLKELIAQKGALSGYETQELMSQLLDAISCAHAKGIVHRDLKPQNIMVSKTGSKPHIKVLDFGIGAFVHESLHQSISQDKETSGTPLYSAPEQLRGEEPSIKSDLYTWGLILLECLTGIPAMMGSSMSEIYQKQLNEPEVPVPSFIREHVLGHLLKRVLDKNPKTRRFDTHTLFHDFNTLDFSSLVVPENARRDSGMGIDLHTQENTLYWRDVKREKRQITALCVKLNLLVGSDCVTDEETLETIQQDQLRMCAETAFRYGGYVSGSIAAHTLIYFGYPQSSDQDARLAGRTALEIVNLVQKRSQVLYKQHRIQLDVGIAIHSGMILAKNHQVPEGITPNIAFELLQHVPKNTILVSEVSRQLLDAFLEFEKYQKHTSCYSHTAIDTYFLVGERRSEVFSQLRATSAHRKIQGRDAEMLMLTKTWASVSPQAGKTILCMGEAGIGKSKLVYEFKKIVLQGQHTVLEARCLLEHKNDSLYPVLTLFRKQYGLHHLTHHGDAVALLEELLALAHCEVPAVLPIFASWLEINSGAAYPASQLSPLQQKELLFESLMKCFAQIVKDQKYLIVLEDLHWADPSTLLFLQTFSQSPFCKNYLLLYTARSDFKPDWPSELVQTVVLSPLSIHDGTAIVKEILAHENVGPEVFKYIIDRTDGIPIFIEEFTAMSLANGQLILDKGQYKLSDNSHIDSVPVTLKALLNARLDQLGMAKETAQLASVVGREVAYEVLAEVSLKDEAALRADLEQLVHADLMYCVRTTMGDRYVFRHALFRDIAYSSQVAAGRQYSHANLAEVLELGILQKNNTYTAAEAERLAIHLYEATRINDAITWLSHTLESLTRKSANQEIVVISYKALAWLHELPEKPEKLQKEFAFRQTLIASLVVTESYGAPSVGTQLELISHLLEKMGEQEELFPSMFVYSTYYMMRGDSKGAMQISKQLAEKAEKRNHTQWVILASAFLGVNLFNNAQFEEAAKVLERALALFDPQQHGELAFTYGMDQEILACAVLASAYAFLGRYTDIPTIEARACQRAELLQHAHSSASMYLGLSCTHYYLGNKTAVKSYSEALIALNASENMHMFGNYGIILNAWADNDLDRAKEAMQAEEASGMFSMRSFWYAVIATIELERGLLNEAQARLETGLSFIGIYDGALYNAELHRLLGALHKQKGDEITAKTHLNQAMELATAQQAHMVRTRVVSLMEDL